MDIIGLKNCPFCNEKPEIHVLGDTYGSRTYYEINCKCKMASTGDDCTSIEEAISLWNIRNGIKYDAIELIILNI